MTDLILHHYPHSPCCRKGPPDVWGQGAGLALGDDPRVDAPSLTLTALTAATVDADDADRVLTSIAIPR